MDMKDNKSPGVDGIPHKLLLKSVEQINISLATVFNLLLEESNFVRMERSKHHTIIL